MRTASATEAASDGPVCVAAVVGSRPRAGAGRRRSVRLAHAAVLDACVGVAAPIGAPSSRLAPTALPSASARAPRPGGDLDNHVQPVRRAPLRRRHDGGDTAGT